MPTSRSSLAFVLPGFDLASAGEGAVGLGQLFAASGEMDRAIEDCADWQPWQWRFVRLAQLQSPVSYPSAPTTWLGSGNERALGSWLHADPVHLEMTANGLSLRECGGWRAADLELVRSLASAHCAGTDFEWHRAGGHLFLQCKRALDIQTVSPFGAARMPLEAALPRGSDSGPVRRLMTELQMLIHEKFSEPLAPNAVWLWGHGTFDEIVDGAHRMPLLWTNDPYARGVYRMLGGDACCRALPKSLDGVLNERADTHIVVAPALTLAELEREWFVPASRALEGGRLDRVELHDDSTSVIARTSLLGRVLARGRRLVQRASFESRP